jgi:diguanylate cyclase (GGDEF)-like protein/PAS domain S-box-containing protein
MWWEFSPYSLSLLLTTLITVGFTIYTWRRRTIPGAFPFISLMLAVAELSLGYAFEYHAVFEETKLFWARVEYLGIVSVPVAWLLFALQYTGYKRVRMRRFVLSLLVVPALTLLLVWTNDLHGLIWSHTGLKPIGEVPVLDLEYGYWFWFHTGYSYLLMALGTLRLIRFYINSRGVYRKQIRTVLLGMFIPWLGNVLYISQIDQFPYDLSPFAFLIAGIIATWSFLRLQFLDILPLARDAILDRMQDGVMVLDARNRILDINPAAQAIIGLDPAQVLGRDAELAFADYAGLVQRFLPMKAGIEVVTGGAEESPQYWEVRVSSLQDPNGHFAGRLVVLHDVTELQLAKLALQTSNIELESRVHERTAELEAANEKLRETALHDSLTGLPNRRLFMDHLENAFDRMSRRAGVSAAVLFMDLDRFKTINDNLGHARGDAFLSIIGSRLKNGMRAGDTVARIGGDEFAVLLEDIQEIGEALQIAERLQQELAAPTNLDGHEVFTTASIGIARATADYHHPDDLLRDADIAMYRAKAKGRGRCEAFTAREHDLKQHYIVLPEDFSQALAQGEFELHYQPIVDLKTGEIVSVEALLRWNHPRLGTLFPDQFLQQAETSAWIAPIGEWVLQSACAQARDWHASGYDWLHVGVNLSTRQFFELKLHELLPGVIAETGLSPQFLDLEISENTAVEDIDRTMEILAELSRMGVQVSIDNFGESHLSIDQLDRLAASSLKIDCAFGMDGKDPSRCESVGKEIIDRAHSLRLNVIGKRVETRGQLAILASRDFDQIQGYLFSQAVPAHAAAELFGAARREAFLTFSQNLS